MGKSKKSARKPLRLRAILDVDSIANDGLDLEALPLELRRKIREGGDVEHDDLIPPTISVEVAAGQDWVFVRLKVGLHLCREAGDE